MELFFELIQLSIGEKNKLSREPTEKEWLAIYEMATMQCVLGLLFSAINKLNEADAPIKPPMELFFQWIGDSLEIEAQNKRLDEAAKRLTEIFRKGQFRSCVLKGQGMARLYPDPNLRQPGDIDLWVDGSRKEILNFLRSNHYDTGHVVIHHVDCTIFEDVLTEIHFIPVWAYNPFVNWRLQKYFHKHREAQFCNYDANMGFAYPTNCFNAVYCLSHIYMHFLYEGIGMRQMIDYYFVVKSLSKADKDAAYLEFKHIGLEKMAAAVMYLLHVVCGMNEDELICKMDSVRGRLLLNEIMLGGNFGHNNDRLTHSKGDSRIRKNMRRLKREMAFLRYYPMDVISIPFWKVGHYVWRKWNGYL